MEEFKNGDRIIDKHNNTAIFISLEKKMYCIRRKGLRGILSPVPEYDFINDGWKLFTGTAREFDKISYEGKK